ncbi:hypothetical protein AVEN_179527-1 [Araneus ventricosus]|uniref:Uncharacterized protein n=1 Tax=Araneus ventricosus TaxID=182803 RepID=A0A4Y2NY62_ARAVE|nr:hypothetical protein AVEN_179527-1 [Araneus ventricosus]
MWRIHNTSPPPVPVPTVFMSGFNGQEVEAYRDHEGTILEAREWLHEGYNAGSVHCMYCMRGMTDTIGKTATVPERGKRAKIGIQHGKYKEEVIKSSEN